MATHEPETEPQSILGPEDAGRPVSSEEFAGASTLEPWSYERSEGRLVVMAPDGEGHVATSLPLLRHLVLYQATHPALVGRVVPNAWVRIDEGTDRIGDIGVYLEGESKRRPIPDQVPELMFEVVSPGRVSRDRDYVEKRADYHRLGIREYVVVDRFERTMTVFTQTPEGYGERVLTRAERYETPLLPGLAIPLAEVFAS